MESFNRLTIREVRLMREISQQAMADGLGIDRGTYIKLEKEPQNLTIAQAKRVAELLNVDYDRLIFLPDDSTASREKDN